MPRTSQVVEPVELQVYLPSCLDARNARLVSEAIEALQQEKLNGLEKARKHRKYAIAALQTQG